jgi:hypothetical protein
MPHKDIRIETMDFNIYKVEMIHSEELKEKGEEQEA